MPGNFYTLSGLCFHFGQSNLNAYDLDAAIVWFTRAADFGDKQAHMELGKLFFRKSNSSKAEEHFLHALKSGILEAYFQLGELNASNQLVTKALGYYFEGAIRGEKNSLKALTLSAKPNQLQGYIYLGIAYEKLNLFKQAEKTYLSACTECEKLKLDKKVTPANLATIQYHYANAMYKLAQLYSANRYEGVGIVITANLTETIRLYRKAVEAGCAHSFNELLALSKTKVEAALNLAQMFQETNPEKAIEFYSLASTLKDRKADLTIANIYKKGSKNFKPNLKKACEYLQKASLAGSIEASLELAELYQYDQPDMSINLERAWDAYIQAVKNGCREEALAPLERLADEADSTKQLALADLYVSIKDRINASKWFHRAAEFDTALAKQKLAAFLNSSSVYNSVASTATPSLVGWNSRETNTKVLRHAKFDAEFKKAVNLYNYQELQKFVTMLSDQGIERKRTTLK